MAFSMLKIRRPLGRLIFNMGIAIPDKTVFLIETAPRPGWQTSSWEIFYTISLSSLYKPICQIYFVECVWVRFSIFYLLSIIHHMGLCGFSFPFPLWWLREYKYILSLIIIIKSEVWTIIHCLWLGHGTMVCPVCLSLFLVILLLGSCIYLSWISTASSSALMHI